MPVCPSPHTPFSLAIEVHPVPGSTTLFTSTIPRDWSGSPAAHDGFLQALVFSAARTYFCTHHPARFQPDPINTHLQYLQSVPAGDTAVRVTPVQLGKRVSVVRVEILLAGRGEEEKVGLLATVTQGNLREEKGLSLPTLGVRGLSEGELPRREDCVLHIHEKYIEKLAPGALKVEQWRVPHVEEMGAASRSLREAWYRFSDGTAFDI